MSKALSKYLRYVAVLGISLPLVSFLLGLIFGSEWPPLSAASVATTVAVGFFHATWFVPVCFVIFTRPESTRDRAVLVATWGFLGLMMAISPLQDTIRYGLAGLRFDVPRIVIEVTAFALIGVWQARRFSKDTETSGGSAPTPDVV